MTGVDEFGNVMHELAAAVKVANCSSYAVNVQGGNPPWSYNETGIKGG